MSKTLWVVTELYYPEQSATGYYLTRIAEALSTDFEVRVICGHPKNRAFDVAATESRNGVAVRRVISTGLSKNRILPRTVNLVTLTISTLFRMLMSFRAEDSVLVVTNPPSLPFVTALVSKIRRTRCILLIHDVYPEVLLATNVLTGASLIAHLLNRLNAWLYRNVDQIIVLGRDMKRLVEAKLVSEKEPITIITHWADLENIGPTQKDGNTLLRELGIQEKFVIQYSGNMGRTHGIEYILETAGALRGDSDFHFLFIGSGAKYAWARNRVRAQSLSNVSLIPPRPWGELCISLNAADVGIIAFVPGMKGISVPSRMYNLLAAGKPIVAVCDDESELALVVREEQVGWVVAPGKTEQLVQILYDAKNKPSVLREMGERARLAAETKYTFQAAIDEYKRVLDER